MRKQATLIASANVDTATTGNIGFNVQPDNTNAPGDTVYTGDSQLSGENRNTSVLTVSRGPYLSATTGLNSDTNSPPSRPENLANQTTERTTNSRPHRQHRPANNQQRERRIFITLTYVLSSYLICWFPFYIAFDTYAWEPDLVPAGLYSFFFWSTYVNSTLNPIIYAYTNKEFRQAFIKVLKMMCKCSK